MKRTLRFVQSQGEISCRLDSGEVLRLPVVPGILKHPTMDALRRMLTKPPVAKKYTIAALHRAPWSVLRQFDRRWLLACMAEAKLRPGRARAIAFLLG